MAAEGAVTLALLHEGGWDEVIMVAVGLGIAYLVIMWSGRNKGELDDEEEDDGSDAVDTDELPGTDAPPTRDAAPDLMSRPPG
jgi:hypothetical protein